MTEHDRNSRDTESDLFYIWSTSVCLLSYGLTYYMDCLRHHIHLLDHCQMRLLSSCRMLLNFVHLNKFTSLYSNLSFLYAEWWGVGVHVFLSIISRPRSDIRDRHHDVTDIHIKIFNYRFPVYFRWFYDTLLVFVANLTGTSGPEVGVTWGTIIYDSIRVILRSAGWFSWISKNALVVTRFQ